MAATDAVEETLVGAVLPLIADTPDDMDELEECDMVLI